MSPVYAFDRNATLASQSESLSRFFWQLASILQPLASYRSPAPSAPFRLPACVQGDVSPASTFVEELVVSFGVQTVQTGQRQRAMRAPPAPC